MTRRAVAAAVAAAVCAGALAAWVTAPDDPPLDTRGALTVAQRSPTTSDPVGTATSAPAVATPSEVAAHPAVAPATVVATPTRLTIARLGVRMPVMPVGVDSAGHMVIPTDPDSAGWYRYGPSPASAAGATVIAAHVDTAKDGTGPLAGLRSARRGDLVTVSTTRGAISYVVTGVVRIPKSDVDLKAVFTRVGPPQLHLLTCGGAFDRDTGHYEDNIIVVAEPRRR